MQTLGLLFLLILGMFFSVRERKFFLMWRSAQLQSPFSKALSQLVGTAGGIYLSIELLISFLKIPEDFIGGLWSFAIEPVALISLLIAIIQPFVIKAWFIIKRK